MKSIIFIALVAFASAAVEVPVPVVKPDVVMPHVPKVTVTNVVQHVPVPHVDVPRKVQHVIDTVHQHIPQVVNHRVAERKRDEVKPVTPVVPVVVEKKVIDLAEVPAHVQQIAQQAHEHIPQVVNHHVHDQQKDKEAVKPVVVVPTVPTVVPVVKV